MITMHLSCTLKSHTGSPETMWTANHGCRLQWSGIKLATWMTRSIPYPIDTNKYITLSLSPTFFMPPYGFCTFPLTFCTHLWIVCLLVCWERVSWNMVLSVVNLEQPWATGMIGHPTCWSGWCESPAEVFITKLPCHRSSSELSRLSDVCDCGLMTCVQWPDWTPGRKNGTVRRELLWIARLIWCIRLVQTELV